MSPSRLTAWNVLLGVSDGAHASDLLLEQARELASRDAGLASEIVFGCLRFRAQLDLLIGRYSGRAAGALDEEVLIALRMAIYQLRYLDRIPAHAAVQESVELVKRSKKRSAAGFVNAVLRKVNREPVVWPDRTTALSCPEWLLTRWERQFGAAAAAAVAEAFLAPPESFIRVPAGREPPADAQPTEIPGCFSVQDAAGFRRQDIGSQSIVPLLALERGQTFLDVCAAPGNKTAQALESSVRATACDLYLKRLQMLNGLGCQRVVANAARPLPFVKRFERILADVPCSGTGTLGRNPEIKWRLEESSLARHQERQVEILKNALDQLAKGGRLVYSTCSLEVEENEQVVERGAQRFSYPIDSKRTATPGGTVGTAFSRLC